MTVTDESRTTEERPLGHAVTRALAWSTLSQILGRLGSFGVGIVLARLLTKEDFGAYAVTLVAINLLIVVNDLGVIAAVIRWHGDARAVAGTAATVSVVSSLAFFACACVAAGPFARALDAPGAANLVRIVSVCLVIDGVSAAHQAMLVREFRNDRIAVAEFTGFLVGTPVTVVLAALGAGPWSVVLGRVVGSLAVGVMVIRSSPIRIAPAYDRAVARALLRFGAPLALSAVVSQGVLNVDYVVVGRSLGAVELGIYLLAFNLSSWPASLVSTAIARVAFAGFSRLVEDRERLTVALPRSIGVAASALVPLVVILAVLAPEVIELVYGDRWLPAATPLRFLLVLGGLRILIDLLVDLAIADGRPGVALRVRTVWLVAVAPFLAIGAALDGLRGVGIAHVVVATCVVVPWLLVDARRSGIPPRAIVAQFARPAVAGAAAAAVMVLTLTFVESVLARLLVVGGLGTIVYAGVLVPRNPLVGWVVGQARGSRMAATA